MSRAKTPPGYLRQFIALAVAQGWRVEGGRKSGHWRFTPPTGRFVDAPSTPSDYRGQLNLVAKLRRAGLDIPHERGTIQ